ncbi:MAG: hypothetical protein ACK46D_02785, partial [Roseiflexaceae bacterium]
QGIQTFQDLGRRNVRMVVLTNSLAATDEPLAHTGYARYRRQLLDAGVVPVIAPISLGADGSYNVNADDAAGAIAAGLARDGRGVAVEVTFVTNVPGVKLNDQVVAQLDAVQIAAAIQSGQIYGGMIPKVNAALGVLTNGAAQARIVDMTGLEVLAQGGTAGTVIVGGGQ